jgi:nucleotide-binding universal stress UspA family protein
MIASARPPKLASEATSSTDEITSGSPHRRRPFDLSGRTVLLAMDGSAGAAAAANIALALATTFHAQIHVVSVIDTRGAPIPPPLDLALALGNELAGEGVHHAQMNQVRVAISTATSVKVDWPVRIVMGAPAGVIVHEAKRLGAALIVVGLRPHGRLARMTNDETVLNVMRNARCAVLGVVPGMVGLPTRALAALDFTDSSLLAARMASGLIDKGTVVLGYVSGPTGRLPEDGESIVHELGVQEGFERAAKELARPGLSIDDVVLRHELPSTPAQMLLDYADGAKSELIAAGSSRPGRLDRWIMGSVSTDLVRAGRHSVLIVPP